jgi:uncharacterized protein
LSSLLPTIPAGVPPWWYYTAIGLSVVLTGLSKAGFGGGVGILALPLMALVVGPAQMLGITLPLLIVCDILSNLHHLGHYDWKQLRGLLPGAVGGVVLGTAVLWQLRGMPPEQFNHIMSLVIGGICLAVVAMQAYRLTGREVPTLPPHPASAVGVGFVAGTVSTINHSAGPIVTVYLLHAKLPKRLLTGTLLLYFLLINSVKVPTYLFMPLMKAADGSMHPFINAATLHDSIWFIPLIPVGTLLGAWMHHRIPEKPFNAVMYLAAAATAGQMVIKSVMH